MVNDLVRDRIAVATLAEKAKAELGSRFAQWWRENGLPADWDWRYIRIAKNKQRWIDNPNQLLLAIESDEGREPQQRRGEDCMAWVKTAGRLRATLTTEKIGAMTADERQTARLHLAPLVELYNRLED
jgi:hypothetical protein